MGMIKAPGVPLRPLPAWPAPLEGASRRSWYAAKRLGQIPGVARPRCLAGALLALCPVPDPHGPLSQD
jgi:hypothetical protein